MTYLIMIIGSVFERESLEDVLEEEVVESMERLRV